MFEILKTSEFEKWIDNLRDVRGRARVLVRIERLADGNSGDSKSVGDGVFELRLDFGPGYRVYYRMFGCKVVVLLAGGDKSIQHRDIRLAKSLSRRIDEDES